MIKTSLRKIGLASIGALLSLVVVSSFGVSNASAAVTSNLSFGSRGAQVSQLQQFLATNPLIYPAGLVTGYYGPLTRAAVRNLQIAYNISPTGTVDSVTRGAINEVMASGLGLDISAPIITSLSVDTSGGAFTTNSTSTGSGNQNATIKLATNEAARVKVYYSTSPIVVTNTFDSTGKSFVEPSVVNASVAPFTSDARTSHSVNINGLSSRTTYNYIVVSTDASNNVSISYPATFQTGS